MVISHVPTRDGAGDGSLLLLQCVTANRVIIESKIADLLMG